MRLHLVDVLLFRARLFGRADAYPWLNRTAVSDLCDAASIGEDCGYGRRIAEIADAITALTM
jgi:hypothetical protein